MLKMNSKKGSVTVFVCIFFLTLVSMIFVFIDASKMAATESSSESLLNIWTDSILAEYDLNLQKRYNVFGFYGYPSDIAEKLDFYAEESFESKKYIEYGGSRCSLYDYSLINPEILEKQIVKAGKLALTEKFIRPEKEIQPVLIQQEESANHGNIFQNLPSEGTSGSFSVTSLTDRLKEAESIKGTIKETGDEYFVNQYIFSYFKNQSDNKNLGKTYFENEAEYIICGKKSDEANGNSVRRKIVSVREGLNFAYLNKDPGKKSQALAAAEILTPGPEAVATQQAILAAWALAESYNDYQLLIHGHRVPLMKTSASWATDLDSILENKTTGYIFTGIDKGEAYEDYLSFFTYSMDSQIRLLRIMDLIQINMRYMYYDSFLLRDYNGGLLAEIKVNGEEYEMVKTY